MSLPSAIDIINFLQGYGLDSLTLKSSEIVTANYTTNKITITGGYAYADGDLIKLTSTLTVPSPLVASTLYYVITVDATTIRLATTYANAIAGASITLTGNGTGVITLSKYDYTQLTIDWITKRRDNFIVPYVERITRQSLSGIATATEYHSGTGKNIMLLDRRPVISLTSIAYVLGSGNYTFLNLANIEVVYEEGLLKAKRNYEESFYLPVFAKGDYNIKCIYTYGYASCPSDIAEAITYLCAEQALGFIGTRTGGGAVSVQSYTRNYGERGKYQDLRNDLSKQAHAILSKYKTSVVGA